MNILNLIKYGKIVSATILIMIITLSCKKSDRRDKVIITDITFSNPTFTDIDITFNNESRLIEPGDSVTYYDIAGTTAELYAYTYGKTTDGDQVGLKLEWDMNLDLPGGTDSYVLNVTNDYFFLYMTNYGEDILCPFYVNYDSADETEEDLLIYNDEVKYRTGYYNAYSDTYVRAYFYNSPTTYVEWGPLNFSWTKNQSMNCRYVPSYYVQHSDSVKREKLKVAFEAIPESFNLKTSKKYNGVDLYCH